MVPAGLVSVDSLLLPPALDTVLPGTAPPDNGLGGRLVVRMPRGGCGNALMLMVFRIVFPALFTPGVDFDFGSAEPPLPPGVVGVARCDDEGARRPLFGTFGVNDPGFESEMEGMFPVLLRVLDTGNAGNAVVGGP